MSDARWNYSTDVIARAEKNKDAVVSVSDKDLDLHGEAAEEWTALRGRFDQGIRALGPVLPLLQHFSNSMQALSKGDGVSMSRLFKAAWNL